MEAFFVPEILLYSLQSVSNFFKKPFGTTTSSFSMISHSPVAALIPLFTALPNPHSLYY